jgi:hypothetical protein
LLLLPTCVQAQLPGGAPLLWRDGFINYQGKLVDAKWQIVTGEDGSKFAIDVAHLDRKRHYVAAYQIGNDGFDPKDLFEFQFDCKQLWFVLGNMDTVRASLIERKAKVLVCGSPDAAR